MIGTTLGHYQVLEKLGEGGMGEVYRARDAKLGRDVALKLLSPAFRQQPARVARLQREAQVLASLNHPNIGAIYGLEESDGIPYLVLELVPGETLRGPLPLAEALPIAIQIAEALECAHEKGIVHRDLKPANIKLTPEGRVKVLDFGLAKAIHGDPSDADSATVTSHHTQVGTILGTAAYMSPEQASGRPLDRRSDIWAFGCVLYELLTGQRAFPGSTTPETLAAVLSREPDWNALPAATPARLRELLRRCLQKDLRRRLRDIGDARLDLDWAIAAPPEAAPARRARWPIPAVAAALVAGVILGTLWRRPAAPRSEVVRSVIVLPPGDRLRTEQQPAVAISPDGSRLAYVAGRGSRTQLFLRRLDQFEPQPIPGTEDAGGPFFSPDGEWVGFFAGGKLKKVTLRGSPPVTIADAPNGRGATWLGDDTIVFTPAGTLSMGLWRVPASAPGAKPLQLTTPDHSKGEASHRWPSALPGGKSVLFTIWTGGGFEESRLAVRSLGSGEQRVLFEGGNNPQFAASGHLVFLRQGNLLAAPFDAGRMQLTAQPQRILEGVVSEAATGAAHFDLSRTGTLVYLPGQADPGKSLLWVDPKGSASPLTASRRNYQFPRLSPDGGRLAVTILEATNTDIWVYDLARDTQTRFTFEASFDASPVWTPDGKRLTYRSSRAGPESLYWKPADGSGPEEHLTRSSHTLIPTSWSPDGKWLAYTEVHPNQLGDLWLLPNPQSSGAETKPRVFLQTPFDERDAKFQPGSGARLLAYTSNESGRYEVYIQSISGGAADRGARWQVSPDGGAEPVWATDGRELYYREGDKMMAVEIRSTPSIAAGKPRLLFEGFYERGILGTSAFDVTPNGRFVMARGAQHESPPTQIYLVTNWFAELAAKMQ